MKEKITIAAETRADFGSSANRRLRRSGVIPGVVYGAGNEPTSVQLNQHDFEMMLKHHTSESLLVDLVIDGQAPRKVLVREIQRNAVAGSVQHIDFNEVSMTERLHAPVSIELVGDPVGVTQQGGMLEHLIHEVEIECLPDDLMEVIEVDVSHLALGDSLFVSDIQLDRSKYGLVTAEDVAVASVTQPRVAEAEEATTEEAATAAAPAAAAPAKG